MAWSIDCNRSYRVSWLSLPPKRIDPWVSTTCTLAGPLNTHVTSMLLVYSRGSAVVTPRKGINLQVIPELSLSMSRYERSGLVFGKMEGKM
ncbi:hypothetical protein CEXT_249111 [Caerostris extrusa]|uniref:Uncharacterized protein n=1 Tax=Caerostris extrusa TaxID=172846 RepID=A0AAV4PK09_CAEEX|nr:hypothetical protein CEXT_249111 [Caerostris extrusa]